MGKVSVGQCRKARSHASLRDGQRCGKRPDGIIPPGAASEPLRWPGNRSDRAT